MKQVKGNRQILFTAVIALVLVTSGMVIPGNVQAFGSLTENGTAAFMGIGINPTKILHVSGTGPGTVPLFQRASDSAGFIIERTPTNRWVLGVNESPTLGNGFVLSTIPFGTTSVPRLLVTQDGRVVIGTTNPTYGKLDVEATDNMAVYAVTNGSSEDSYAIVGRYGTTGPLGIIGGVQRGVYGQSNNSEGAGVYGYNSSSGAGVYGSNGSDGPGVYGFSETGQAGYFEGNATVTGSLLTEQVYYESARTHYCTFTGADFTPTTDNVSYSNYGNVIAGLYATVDDGQFVAPVHLPDGAVVTEFEIYYNDNSANDLGCSLRRQPLLGMWESMGSATSSGTPGVGSSSDTEINSPTIDNESYGYFILAFWAHAGSSDLRLIGTRITYTIASAE